jgi:hypothetical protein
MKYIVNQGFEEAVLSPIMDDGNIFWRFVNIINNK